MKKKRCDLPHYVINNGDTEKPLFIAFDDAIRFCDKHDLSYGLIQKSYYY